MWRNYLNLSKRGQVRPILSLLLLLEVVLVSAGMGPASAEPPPLKVAAASDLQFAFTALGKAFEKKSGRKVTFSFGSTGTLARQIENGAPFDAFFAANEQFVMGLEEHQLLVPGTRRLYATGRIVLASSVTAKVPVNKLLDLLDPRIKRVAIANPTHAPYGFAAREALQKAGVWGQLQPKLVLGGNIRQVLQFIQTGNADAGIVALSVVNVPQVRYREIDSKTYSPLKQAAAVIRRSREARLAGQFIDYVCSPQGQAVMKRYGFLPPAGR